MATTPTFYYDAERCMYVRGAKPHDDAVSSIADRCNSSIKPAEQSDAFVKSMDSTDVLLDECAKSLDEQSSNPAVNTTTKLESMEKLCKYVDVLSIGTEVVATHAYTGSGLSTNQSNIWFTWTGVDMCMKILSIVIKCMTAISRGEHSCTIDLNDYRRSTILIAWYIKFASIPDDVRRDALTQLDPANMMSAVAEKNGWRLTRPVNPRTEHEYIMLLK